MRPVDADLLSATSLLVGAVGLLYGAWQAELTAALRSRVAPKRLDRAPERARVRRTIRGRAVPLVAATGALVLIFLPSAVQVVTRAATLSAEHPVAALRRYDPVPAAFLAVYLVAVVLAATALATLTRLRRLAQRLAGPDLNDG
ncbi:hypothetical protein [Luedemannella helvata]|uniref:Uncharacterized protein n=1 Tax=Luedemannella helvata TaxID=349315 RepID=A0ABP4WKN6_9ACTN